MTARYFKQSCGEQEERLGLLHPAFNLRECAKQMVLVQDHLEHPYKLCADCVRKHLLTIEAYAEEATSLDEPNGFYSEMTESLANDARNWMEDFEDGKPPPEIAQRIRAVRKALVPLVCDPRGAANRVAALYLASGVCCPHRNASVHG